MFAALSNFVSPIPVQTTQRKAISLEELGIPDLKKTAALTAVLNEDVQTTAEQAIQQANPNVDFSDAAIDQAKRFMFRVDGQIEKHNRQIEQWQNQKADLESLMPLFDAMSKIRSKGKQRVKLNEALFRSKHESRNAPELSPSPIPSAVFGSSKTPSKKGSSAPPSENGSSKTASEKGCKNGCSECLSSSSDSGSSDDGSFVSPKRKIAGRKENVPPIAYVGC